MVGNESHRIDRFACGTSGDQHLPAGERLGLGLEHVDDGGKDLVGFRHAARPKFATGHFAVIGTDHRHPISLQRFDVARGRRVVPHANVHGGGREHTLVSGQQCCGSKIVG